jgi:hypothetical protein
MRGFALDTPNLPRAARGCVPPSTGGSHPDRSRHCRPILPQRPQREELTHRAGHLRNCMVTSTVSTNRRASCDFLSEGVSCALCESPQDETVALFTRTGPSYDAVPRFFSRVAKRLVDRVGIASTSRVLGVATGTDAVLLQTAAVGNRRQVGCGEARRSAWRDTAVTLPLQSTARATSKEPCDGQRS